MDQRLIEQINQLNPWLKSANAPILRLEPNDLIHRKQAPMLLSSDWDSLWLILTGPRRAGKTTLGLYLCDELLKQKKYTQLLYLNCDYLLIREWLKSPEFIQEAIKYFNLNNFILYIDEAQRITNPGLLLKSIVDLHLPIKLIATGSSQLEIKSKVQEHLTGRQIESIVLPLSYKELSDNYNLDQRIVYGCYPQVYQTNEKEIMLSQLYRDYISKDIVEFLKIGNSDVVEKLITLIAHSSGQLVNYSQLSSDCRINQATVQSYLNVLEQTYVIKKVTPFVGNKRTEITSNPVYYFIDNGFRNQALNNFTNIDSRTDNGLLVESAVFRELYKLKTQFLKNFSIHFWRTKSGAVVDFVLYKNEDCIIPIEVKYREMTASKITRSYRSFLQAYKPKLGIIITKNWLDEILVEGCKV